MATGDIMPGRTGTWQPRGSRVCVCPGVAWVPAAGVGTGGGCPGWVWVPQCTQHHWVTPGPAWGWGCRVPACPQHPHPALPSPIPDPQRHPGPCHRPPAPEQRRQRRVTPRVLLLSCAQMGQRTHTSVPHAHPHPTGQPPHPSMGARAQSGPVAPKTHHCRGLSSHAASLGTAKASPEGPGDLCGAVPQDQHPRGA